MFISINLQEEMSRTGMSGLASDHRNRILLCGKSHLFLPKELQLSVV